MQVILISATFPDELESFVKSFAPGAARISVESPTKLVLGASLAHDAVALPLGPSVLGSRALSPLLQTRCGSWQ